MLGIVKKKPIQHLINSIVFWFVIICPWCNKIINSFTITETFLKRDGFVIFCFVFWSMTLCMCNDVTFECSLSLSCGCSVKRIYRHYWALICEQQVNWVIYYVMHVEKLGKKINKKLEIYKRGRDLYTVLYLTADK